MAFYCSTAEIKHMLLTKASKILCHTSCLPRYLTLSSFLPSHNTPAMLICSILRKHQDFFHFPRPLTLLLLLRGMLPALYMADTVLSFRTQFKYYLLQKIFLFHLIQSRYEISSPSVFPTEPLLHSMIILIN